VKGRDKVEGTKLKCVWGNWLGWGY